MVKKKLIIIRGTSGVGKSTVAKLLAEKLKSEHKNLVLIPFDLSMAYLIKNLKTFNQKTVNLMQKNTEDLIKNFLEEGYTVITEGIFYKKYLRKLSLKRLLSIGKKYSAKTIVIELESDIKTILSRIDIRAKKEPYHDNSHKNAKMRFELFEKNKFEDAIKIDTRKKKAKVIVEEIITILKTK